MLVQLDYHVDRAEVRRYLGYRPGLTEESHAVNDLLEQSITAVGRYAQPQGLVKTYPLGCVTQESISLKGTGLALNSHDLVRLLTGCSLVSLLLVTLGASVDQLTSDLLTEGRYAAAAAADASGSAAAEDAMEQLQDQVRLMAKNSGFQLTRRFSPGYGDFPLRQQRDLLRLLDASQIGVSLTPSNLLLPQKSITAVLGWRQDSCPTKHDQKCGNCPLYSCQFRDNSREGEPAR